MKKGYPGYLHLTGHPIGEFYKPVIAEFIDYSLEEDRCSGRTSCIGNYPEI